jgi:hypothetical protein
MLHPRPGIAEHGIFARFRHSSKHPAPQSSAVQGVASCHCLCDVIALMFGPAGGAGRTAELWPEVWRQGLNLPHRRMLTGGERTRRAAQERLQLQEPYDEST